MTRSESQALERAEWVAAFVLTALAVLAHIELRRHAGPLWRDEAGTLNVATMPSIQKLWAGLEFDWFPVLPTLVLRAVVAVLGSGDGVVRTFGLLVGLAMLSAAWWSIRAISRALPLFSLVLLAGSGIVVRYGDSLRGYGMGTVFILAAFGLSWRAVQRTSMRPIVWALIFSVLSVQCLYQNAILVGAVCCGGAAVGLLRKSWKVPVAFAAIGFASALSLVPYASIMTRTERWNGLLKQAVELSAICQDFSQAVGLSGSYLAFIWVLLIALAVAACAYRVSTPSDDQERFAFLGASGLASALGYAVFFGVAGYPPRMWYFVPAVTFLAVVADAVFGPLLQGHRTLRVLKLGAALLLVAVTSLVSWPGLQARQSRVDQAAIKLQELASKDDLIVVEPWEYGISFDRYYLGATRWTTLPALSDHRAHRYDLIKEAMLDSAPVDSVLNDVAATLRSGHRVWLVGRTAFPPSEETLPRLPPPPLPDTAWHAGPYMLEWSDRLSQVLQQRAQMFLIVPLPEEPVSRFEDLQLLEFWGWSG